MSQPSASTQNDQERAAAFDQIVQWGEPILRNRTTELRTFDQALEHRARYLAAVMEGAGGAGLAAPQVGDAARLFVYRPQPGAPIRALVNAKITERSNETELGPEGCLSLGRANVIVEVERAVAITVEAQEIDGTPATIKAEGAHARVLQHEIDHLDGVLMLDHASKEQRRNATRALLDGTSYVPSHLLAD